MSYSFTPEICLELAEFAKNSLGKNFDKLQKKYNNAQLNNDIKYEAPRLIHLYNVVRESAETLQRSPISADVVAIVELTLLRSLAEKACSPGEWKELSSELGDDNSYVHTVILLSFVLENRSRGTKVEIVPSNSSEERTPDARMYTPADDVIDVEVKARRTMWAPSAVFSDEEAMTEVKTAWKKARKGTGQLGNNTSLLVIGGVYVNNDNQDAMSRVSEKFLMEKENKDTLLIENRSITIIVDGAEFEEGIMKILNTTTVTPQIKRSAAINPHYAGIIEIIESEQPPKGMSHSTKKTSEHTIKGDDVVGAWNNK